MCYTLIFTLLNEDILSCKIMAINFRFARKRAASLICGPQTLARKVIAHVTCLELVLQKEITIKIL